MNEIQDWQECEAMGHVGPVRDATVAWVSLGLMCDACSEALGDTRPLQQQLAAAVEALAELVRLKDGPRDDAYRAAKDAAWGHGTRHRYQTPCTHHVPKRRRRVLSMGTHRYEIPANPASPPRDSDPHPPDYKPSHHTTAQSQTPRTRPVSAYADMGGHGRVWARVCTRGVPKGPGGR
jgi:hypothetical protein